MQSGQKQCDWHFKWQSFWNLNRLLMCQTKQLVADHTTVTTQPSSARHWLVGWLVGCQQVGQMFI